MSISQPPITNRASLPTEAQKPQTVGFPEDPSDAARTPTLLLTVEEAAESLRLSRTLVYELVSSGELRSVKIGRARRVSVRALQDYVNRLEA